MFNKTIYPILKVQHPRFVSTVLLKFLMNMFKLSQHMLKKTHTHTQSKPLFTIQTLTAFVVYKI